MLPKHQDVSCLEVKEELKLTTLTPPEEATEQTVPTNAIPNTPPLNGDARPLRNKRQQLCESFRNIHVMWLTSSRLI